jgi:hypothetical protein
VKLLPILLIFISVSVSVYAKDDCIFDETAYIEFIKKTAQKIETQKLSPMIERSLLIEIMKKLLLKVVAASI